jgi:two-component system cell cycle sensor histidine kinase/response regulator CckA
MLHGEGLYCQLLCAMSAGPVSSQKQVLAIDDEPEILDLIERCLGDAGFQVLVASGPQEGLELYEKHHRQIGLVLLDYLMPDMMGDLVFECLQRTNPDVRVILLTGCEESVAHKMFEAGLRGFIQKPFYLDDFVQRVREELNEI